MKLFLMMLLLVLIEIPIMCYGQASSPSPAPSAAPAIQAVVSAPQSGIMGWVAAHGGMMAVVLMIVLSANAILSALRKACATFDGVPEGQDGTPDMKALNLLNKLCFWSGKILDYLQGNVKH